MQFTPAAAGARNALLTPPSNDAFRVENPTITLTGTGVAPNVSAGPGGPAGPPGPAGATGPGGPAGPAGPPGRGARPARAALSARRRPSSLIAAKPVISKSKVTVNYVVSLPPLT